MTTKADTQSASPTTLLGETFAAVVDNMFDALLILRAVRNADGAVVDFAYDYANAAVADHLGDAPTELVGSTVLTVAPHFGELDVFATLIEVVEVGTPLDLVVDGRVGQRSSGEYELRARRLDDRIALTVRNVTERRAHEALLAQALAELTAANEQLGEFAAMAAHDLASPLRAISGFADVPLVSPGRPPGFPLPQVSTTERGAVGATAPLSRMMQSRHRRPAPGCRAGKCRPGPQRGRRCSRAGHHARPGRQEPREHGECCARCVDGSIPYCEVADRWVAVKA